MGLVSARRNSGSRFSFRRKKQDDGFLSYLNPSKLQMSLTAITEEDVEKWMCDMGLLYSEDDDDDDDTSVGSYETSDTYDRGCGMPKAHPLLYIPVLTWDQAMNSLPNIAGGSNTSADGSSQDGSGGASTFEDLESKLSGFWQSLAAADDDQDVENANTPKRSRSVRFADEPTIHGDSKSSKSPWKKLRRQRSKIIGPKGKRWKMVAFKRPGKKSKKTTDETNTPFDEETASPTSILKDSNDTAVDDDGYFFSLVPEDALESVNRLLFPAFEENEEELDQEAEDDGAEVEDGAIDAETTDASVPFDESVNGSGNNPESPRSVMTGLTGISQSSVSSSQKKPKKPRRKLLKSLSSKKPFDEPSVIESVQESETCANEDPMELTLENSPPPPKRRLDKVRKATSSVSNMAKMGIASTLASTRSIASSRSIGKSFSEDSFDLIQSPVSVSPSNDEVEVTSTVASMTESKTSSRRKAHLGLPSLKAPSFKRLSMKKSKAEYDEMDDVPREVPVRISILDQNDDAQTNSPSTVAHRDVARMLEAEDNLNETLQCRANKRDAMMVEEIHPWKPEALLEEDEVQVAAKYEDEMIEEVHVADVPLVDNPVPAAVVVADAKPSKKRSKKSRSKKTGDKERIPINSIEFPSDFDPALDDRFGDEIEDPLIVYVKKPSDKKALTMASSEDQDDVELPLGDYLKTRSQSLDEDDSVTAIVNPHVLILQSTTTDDDVIEEEQPWNVDFEEEQEPEASTEIAELSESSKEIPKRLPKRREQKEKSVRMSKKGFFSSFKGRSVAPSPPTRGDDEEIHREVRISVVQ